MQWFQRWSINWGHCKLKSTNHIEANVGFWGEGKTGVPGKNLPEQRKNQQQTQLAHVGSIYSGNKKKGSSSSELPSLHVWQFTLSWLLFSSKGSFLFFFTPCTGFLSLREWHDSDFILFRIYQSSTLSHNQRESILWVVKGTPDCLVKTT